MYRDVALCSQSFAILRREPALRFQSPTRAWGEPLRRSYQARPILTCTRTVRAPLGAPSRVSRRAAKRLFGLRANKRIKPGRLCAASLRCDRRAWQNRRKRRQPPAGGLRLLHRPALEQKSACEPLVPWGSGCDNALASQGKQDLAEELELHPRARQAPHLGRSTGSARSSAHTP